MSALLSKSFSAPALDEREIFRYARCVQPGPAERALLDEVLAEVGGKLAYKVCWREFDVTCTDDLCDFGGIAVRSRSLAAALEGCEKAVIFAATIGLELDRMIVRYNRLSPSKALFFQALGAERVEALCDKFCAELGAEYESADLVTKPRFSAGYGDLPLDFQKDIFAVLDCSRRIGVTLNESLLMSPSKSVTAVVGLTAKKGERA